MQTYSVSGQSITVDPEQGYAILRGKRYIAISDAYPEDGYWKIRYLCPDDNAEFFLTYDLPQNIESKDVIFKQPSMLEEI